MDTNIGFIMLHCECGDALMSEESDVICMVLAGGDVGVNEMIPACKLLSSDFSLAKYSVALAELQKARMIVLDEEQNIWHLLTTSDQKATGTAFLKDNMENPVYQEETSVLKKNENFLDLHKEKGNIDKISDAANLLSAWMRDVKEWHAHGEDIMRQMQDVINRLQEREKILRDVIQTLKDQV